MGVKEKQKRVQAYRGQIVSPGRPTVAWREDRVRFWAAISRGRRPRRRGGSRGFRAGGASVVPACWRGESMSGSDGLGAIPVIGLA